MMAKLHSLEASRQFKAIIGCVLLILHVSVSANEPLIVAHRGASGQAPENTLPAFKLAWEQGADVVEGDFQLTKDGHIVCVHDRDTKRVSGEKIIVKDSTLAELQRLDVGSFKGAEFKGTRIPTIAEVFELVPEGKTIFIELKSGKEIVPQLLKDLKKSELDNDQIVVICFDADVLLEISRKAPEIKLSWLVNFKKGKDGEIQPQVNTAFKILKLIKADGIGTSKKFVDEEFIKRVHSLGYKHHVWTVNDLPTARNFQQWGTRSITTDFPAEIRKGLLVAKEQKVNQ